MVSMAANLYVTDDINKSLWVVHSAATSHMCDNRHLFDEIRPTEQKVWIGKNSTMEAKGIGTVRMISELRGNEQKITLQDILYVPKLRPNLFGVTKCRSGGYRVTVGND